MKKFNELRETDSIYFVSPIDGEVHGFKIKTISGVDPEKAKSNESLKYWVRVEVFHNAAVVHSPDIEKIPTITFYFDGRLTNQLAIVGTQLGPDDRYMMPTLFSPSKTLLDQWIKVTS